MACIYFLCPDFERPSGGTRTIYWYACQLRRAGFDAVVVHQKRGFRLSWHGIEVPIASLDGGWTFNSRDVLVFTEGMTRLMQQLASQSAIKTVLALQWVPNYLTLEPGDTWANYGIRAILTPSQAIAGYLQWRLADLPVAVIPAYIDGSRYRYEESAKEPTIAYVPRKTHDLAIVRAVVESREGLRSPFSWQALANLSEEDYARHLRRCRFYLAPSDREGLNVSVLEAMACGCLAIGYSGVGGNEFMVASGDGQNYIPVENGNLPALGVALERVLATWRQNPHPLQAIVQNAVATATRYQDRDREWEALKAFFANLLSPQAEVACRDSRAIAAPTPSGTTDIPSLAQRARQLKQNGQLQAALATYREALALDETVPELWFNLGNLWQQLQNRDEAETAYRRALQLKADFFQAHLNLANSLRDRGMEEEAVAHYRQVIALKPDFPLAYRNLGQVLLGLKRSREAREAFAAWSRLEPDSPAPLNGMGIALQAQGHFEQARASFEQALALDPKRFDMLNNLGTLLRMLRRPHDALPYLQQAVAYDPDNETAIANLVHTLLNLGRVSEALARVEALLERKPNSAVAHSMRGYALVQQARITDAISCFDRCWQLDASATTTISNALFSLLYRDDLSPTELSTQLRSWAKRLPVPAVEFPPQQPHLDRDRPLKIGYLSADLRAHPVAFFLEPILTHHDPRQVEVVAYDIGGVADATTARLKEKVALWRSCVGWSNESIARQIHDDRIDILVDLGGHTQGNRAPVLACQPAPIQILYIGYPSTTGMESVDYIISDAAVSPPESEHLYTERILRVEGSFWCFKPHDFAPQPSSLPALTNGFITFGCFNNSPKLSPTTLRLWARVLDAVPNVRLRLKALAFADEPTRAYFRHQLLAFGVASERIIIEPPTLRLEKFFEAYQSIDIALDPTPYNGGTTTCESLWMGVPVVTLRGQHFFSRMSHSFLSNVGLGDLSATSEDEYIAIAAHCAADRDRLQFLRATLRDRMAASPICDGRRAARELENAYRRAWYAKVEQAKGDSRIGN